MKNQILNLGKVLNEKQQKLISGGNDPISGDGSTGGGSNSGSTSDFGVCIINYPNKILRVHCDEKCPDGTQPICM